MSSQHKYSRIERERRFLVDQFPMDASVARIRHIIDRYIDGTTLRLRQQSDDNGPTTFKLAQKLRSPGNGAQQGFITNMYLNKEEFHILAQLPAEQLSKTRYSVPPFGIDVFEGRLGGLVLAETEFESAPEADALAVPSFVLHEVSADIRFTGGCLVHASRQDVQDWLSEYGIRFRSP